MSLQSEMNLFAEGLKDRVLALAGGGGFKVVAVNVLTTSGTVGVTGSPTLLLDPDTTHLTGILFGGGASGANGGASPRYVTGYDPEYSSTIWSTDESNAARGGGGGAIEPLPLIRVSDLTFPLSYTVGLGGAKPVAPTAVSNSTVFSGTINAGSDTVFGPWLAGGAPSAAVQVFSQQILSAPGYMSQSAYAQNPRKHLEMADINAAGLAVNYFAYTGGTRLGQGAVGQNGAGAPPGARDLCAPGGGEGGYKNSNNSNIAATKGGPVGALDSSNPPAASTTTTAPVATAASPDGIPFSGLAGAGGSGGAAHRGYGQFNGNAVGGDGGDGGFPGGGGGGGGHASSSSGYTSKGGRGGKGGDGCIVLIQLRAV